MSMIPSNLSKEVEKLLNRIKPGEKVRISIIPGEDQKGKEEVIPVMEQNELIPFEPNAPAIYKPAIYFVDNVVYTPNGSIAHPATVYNTMMDINNHMVDDLCNRSSAKTNKFDKMTADNIIENMANIVMDPFINELRNIFIIFARKINDKWYNSAHESDDLAELNEEDYFKTIDNDAKYGVPYINTGAGEFAIKDRAKQLKDAVMYMVDPGTSEEVAEAIMANTFSLYSISFINLIGMDIYNNIKTEIVRCVGSRCLKANNAEEVLGLFIQDVDAEFANMMSTFTQASLAFCQNMDNIVCSHIAAEETCKF